MSASCCGRGFINGEVRPVRTDAVARVIGLDDVEALHDDGRRIREAIRAGEALSQRDWRRALVATEIVFASSYYGAAGDWEIVAPIDDAGSLSLLCSVQRKLAGLRAPPRSSPDYDGEH